MIDRTHKHCSVVAVKLRSWQEMFLYPVAAVKLRSWQKCVYIHSGCSQVEIIAMFFHSQKCSCSPEHSIGDCYLLEHSIGDCYLLEHSIGDCYLLEHSIGDCYLQNRANNLGKRRLPLASGRRSSLSQYCVV
eukprot:TRINITY_DN4265_c0_g1_i2.p1 TRINITY_DN4265_c0_g1~~TRINITY_DN4265_c0_g1_i2.p1  ORF type:complete len:132 (-),score=16.52 TRINITY_DN4265_c0_g1_i2:174-569(-)